MAMMQTPTARVVVMVVITISNDDDADTDRKLGGDICDHHQQ